jgi:hypothetical protein
MGRTWMSGAWRAPRSLLRFIAATAVVLGLVAVAQSAGGRSVLTTAGLIGSGDHYSELYFTHPEQLPARTGEAAPSVRIQFTLRNREGAARAYAWSLTAAPSGGADARRLSGSVRLLAGRSVTIERRITPRCRGTRERLSVSISNTETIGYWISCLQSGEPRRG